MLFGGLHATHLFFQVHSPGDATVGLCDGLWLVCVLGVGDDAGWGVGNEVVGV